MYDFGGNILKLLFTTIVGAILLHLCEPAASDTKKPNVLMIAIDDLNDYISVFNDPNAITPNFDRLAKRGVWFRNAQCQAPLCGPSRASIMSGLRPSTSGIYGMIADDRIRDDNAITKDIIFLPEYFEKEGYETYGVGKLFHRFAPEKTFKNPGGRFAKNEPNHGFGVKPEKRIAWQGDSPPEYAQYGRTSTDWGAFPSHDSLMTDSENVDWVLQQLQEMKSESPFFMAVGLLRPHVPWHVPQKWFDLYDPDTLSLPPYLEDDFEDIPSIAKEKISFLPMMPTTKWAIETQNWKYILQAYLACISYVDHQVGRMLDQLDQLGMDENTVIIIWSDHGYRIGEKGTFAKHALWEEATNALLYLTGPEIPNGLIFESPVEMLDIYPTLLEVCGLDPYVKNEGQSLLRYLNESSEAMDHYAITTYGRNNHTLRTNDWRLIVYEDGSKELYDKEADPNEFHNLAFDKNYKQIISKLEKLLPKEDSPWHKHSSYKANPYFIEQKARQATKQ